MMDTTTRLGELLNKASKITDSQAEEAAALLLSLYTETHDKAKVADYLMRLKSTVCLFFFEEAIKVFGPEEIGALHAALCATEAYGKNANHAATSRGFIISAVLIKNDVSTARAVFMRTLADAEKESKFSDTVINNFKQYAVEYCGGMELIKALGEKEWEKYENRNRFIRFIEAINSSVVTIVSSPKNSEEIGTTATPIAVVPSVLSEGRISQPISSNELAENITGELLKTLQGASKEASMLLQSLNGGNGTIALLRKEVANRDSRIVELTSTINERNQNIADLQRKFDETKQTVRNNEEHITDLSERLKNSLQMDNISQNQELLTLKTNLQNSLKVEYADYLVSKDSECNPDTYGALLGSLARIFKTLRRFGIMID